MYLFVDLACVTFCILSLPRGVIGWLRLVIVALAGIFSFIALIQMHSISVYKILNDSTI